MAASACAAADHLGVISRAYSRKHRETPREREDVVYLIRVVGATGCDDLHSVFDLFGDTSGVGFAMANTMARSAIWRTASQLTASGAESPMYTSAPSSASSAEHRRPRGFVSSAYAAFSE